MGSRSPKMTSWTTSWPRFTPVACLRPNYWTTGRRHPTSCGGQHNPTLRGSSTRRGANWVARRPGRTMKAEPSSAKLLTPTPSRSPNEGQPPQDQMTDSLQQWNMLRLWRIMPTRRPSASYISRPSWMAKPSSTTLQIMWQARRLQVTTGNWTRYGRWQSNSQLPSPPRQQQWQPFPPRWTEAVLPPEKPQTKRIQYQACTCACTTSAKSTTRTETV